VLEGNGQPRLTHPVTKQLACSPFEVTMAKSISINLPNGRTWAKKGDAIEHYKAMLARYANGQRVSNDSDDFSDLKSLLEVYDSAISSDKLTKIGAGIAHFERRPDLDHPGHTSCFFVVRTDGSSIDFSTRRALDAAGMVGR